MTRATASQMLASWAADHLPALWVVAGAITGFVTLQALLPQDAETAVSAISADARAVTTNAELAPPPFPLALGSVQRVIDGDTYDVVLDENGELVRIRLAWVDAPESDQPFGPEATGWARDALLANQIVLTPQGTDRYGRLVSQVTVRGDHHLSDVASSILRAGLAWVDPAAEERHGSLVEDRELAASEMAGLWADRQPVAPWQWRRGAPR